MCEVCVSFCLVCSIQSIWSKSVSGCLFEVSRVFQRSFKYVSREFQVCFKEVLRVLTKRVMGVSKKFKGFF